MSRKVLWIGAAAGLLAVCASIMMRQERVPEGEFRIEGELTGVPDSTVLSLYRVDGNLLKPMQADTVIDGRFSFRDTITTDPRCLALMGRGEGFPPTWLDVWVGSGTVVHIKGEGKGLRTWFVESRLPEQEEQNRLDDAVRAINEELMPLKIEMERLYMAGKKEEYRALCPKEDSLSSLVTEKTLAFLKERPLSVVWEKECSGYMRVLQYNPNSPFADDIRALYDKLSDADKQTDFGKLFTEYMNLPPVVNEGDEMVDGDLYDLEGRVRHLSEFKGKYILLDFWSRGCGPCVASIPEMEEIAEQYKEQLEVVSISSDTEASWKEFVTERKLTGNQWNELRQGTTGLAAAYRVRGIPHYVLITPDGKVKKMWSGYGKGSLKAKMKELIGE